MSKYKYWHTKKLKELLHELCYGFGGVSTNDMAFRLYIEDLILEREHEKV